MKNLRKHIPEKIVRYSLCNKGYILSLASLVIES